MRQIIQTKAQFKTKSGVKDAEVLVASRAEITSYLINRSFLNKKAKSISEVLEKLKCIQVDPICVVAKNHQLALWNRVENFSPD